MKQVSDVDPKKRLWVVSELYYPEETSTGYYLTKIAEGLAYDFEVKAICGQPNYFRRGTRAPRHEMHKNVEIFRAASTTFDKNVILFRLVNMFTLGVSVLFKCIKHFRKSDKVLVVTTPPLLPFVVCLASLYRGTEYILLIHDNYPELLVAVDKLKERSLLTKITNFFNRWLYKYASRIIVVGRDMKDLLEKKTKGLDIPIDTITNWAELESVEPGPRNNNPLLKELNLLDKFVLLYAGNIGRPNDVETIVKAAEILAKDPMIHFIFLGSGAKKKWLVEEVDKLGLKNITFLDPRPRAEQQIFLNACDIGIVSLVSRMKGVSMPSRTYNIMAAGKPILAIADEDSEIAKVVYEDGVGKLVTPDDVAGLVKAIYELADASEELKKMGIRAREAALEKYSLNMALKQYRHSLS